MKKAIINVANGNWYPKGQKRLKESLNSIGFRGNILTWSNDYPPNSPTHQEVPYAFKIYAFEEAFRQGNELVLWLDASMWAIKSLDPIFDEINNEGHIIFKNSGEDGEIGMWCSDAALQTLKVTREELLSPSAGPGCMGGIVGLNKYNERSLEYLKQIKELSKDGITFHGDWNNNKGQVSSDKRVLGHRHDQTAASIISARLGMKWQPFYDSYIQFPNSDKDTVKDNTIIICQGM